MDKQKEIEKMAYSICPMPQASEYITDCTKCGSNGDCLRQKHAKKFIDKGYGDIKAAAKEAVTGFQAKLTKWLAKQYRESSTIEITAIFDKIEELLEETK